MDRRRYLYALTAGALLAVGVEQAAAQLPGNPGPQRSGPRMGGQMRQRRNPLRDMSPEDRQRFQSNIERWQQMPPEERRELREREGWRQQRLKREAEAAIRDSGLQLEAERRQQFEERYMQERRQIEQALRREIQEKRRRELAPVVERLKSEFSQGTPAPTAAPVSPAASPSPAK